MQRRKFVLGLGSLTAAGAAGVGSGAFTTAEATRDVAVEVADDSTGYLALQASGGPNGQFASQGGDGRIGLEFSGSGNSGSGVGRNSVYNLDDVFRITNQGTQTVYVWSRLSGGSVFDNNSLHFYPNDSRSTELNDSSNSVLTISPGESAKIGVHIDTDSFSIGSDSLTATIQADVDKPSNSESVGPDGDETLVVSKNPDTGDFSSIQSAVNAAGGTTIRVESGTYEESVRIESVSDLTLRANGDVTVVGDGVTTGSQPHAAIHVDDGNGPVRNITIEGFTVRNPDGKFGIFAGTGSTNGSNDGIGGLAIRNNVVENISTTSSGGSLTGGPAGIGIRGDYGTDGNPGIVIDSNVIRNVQTNGYTNAVGITLKSFTGDAGFGKDSSGNSVTDSKSPPATGTEILNNKLLNIDGGDQSRTKGISVSGEFEGVDIINNTIASITTPSNDSTVLGITITENGGSYSGNQYDIDDDSDGERIGPRNFRIEKNKFSDISGDITSSVFIGGYEDLGTHLVLRNNFLDTGAGVTRFAGDQPGYQIGDGDTLKVQDNYWGDPSGPSGEDGVSGSGAPAVTLESSGSDRSGKVDASEQSTDPERYSSSQNPNAGSTL